MKTFLPALGVLMLCSSPVLQADVLGVTVGAEWWQANPEGRMGDTGFSQRLDFDDDSHSAFYAAFEHPIPLLPNLLMRRQTLSFQGDTVLPGELRLYELPYAAKSRVNNELNLEYTDASFYYELLDNDILSMDLGLTARFLQTDLMIRQTASVSKGVSTPMPMLYGNANIGIFGTHSSLFFTGNYGRYNEQQMSDLRAGFAYEWIDLTAFSLTVKLGVQRLELELNNEDRMDADLLMDGAFIGLEADF
jgi:outer membrane protein